jgi:hypothetical protein
MPTKRTNGSLVFNASFQLSNLSLAVYVAPDTDCKHIRIPSANRKKDEPTTADNFYLFLL